MRQKIILSQLLGFAVTSLLGTVLHFLYEWLGAPVWIAPFSAINESTWEHMKLLFWPMLIFAAVQSSFFRERSDFACIKTRGIVLGLILIPVLFYTYNGVIGKSPDWINIAIFFITAAAVYIYEAILLSRGIECEYPKLAITVLFTLSVLFAVFTFFTPDLGIFRAPSADARGVSYLFMEIS